MGGQRGRNNGTNNDRMEQMLGVDLDGDGDIGKGGHNNRMGMMGMMPGRQPMMGHQNPNMMSPMISGQPNRPGYGQPIRPSGYGQPIRPSGYGQPIRPSGYGQPIRPSGYSQPMRYGQPSSMSPSGYGGQPMMGGQYGRPARPMMPYTQVTPEPPYQQNSQMPYRRYQ